MICADCGHEHDAVVESCSACGEDPRLDGRYRLLSVIGQGAFGTTWRGECVSDGHVVCLKELLYQRLASFEPEEQFRREAAVLRQLDLPGVPSYVDDFTITTGRAVSLFLVQELVDGETLAEEMEHKRYREDEVLDILEALLRILDELHSLSPPVVHRDIKPTNVMRRRDGSLVLIDFGAVKDVLNKTRRGGPSVAGTIGFMAPEQLTGHAEPATDLFGAGAMAVALLSRRDPADMLDDDGRLDWLRHVSVSSKAEVFLRSLLAPRIADRPASARAALDALQTARDDAPEPARAPEPPKAKAKAKPKPKPKVQPPADPSPPPIAAPVESLAPARRGSGARSVAIIGAAFAITTAGVAAVISSQADAPPRDPEIPYTVPSGILDLRLGMTLDEAKAAGDDVAGGQPDAVPGRFTTRRGSDDPSPRLPGPFWGFSTTIAGQVAHCQLEFAVDDTLSRIACTFEPFTTIAGFDAAVGSIESQLGEKYRLPATDCVREQPEVVLGDQSNVRCEWTDGNAALLLRGRFGNMNLLQGPGTSLELEALMRTSELRLSLESAKHTYRVEQYRNREAEEEQRRYDMAEMERRAREADEMRRIEEAASRGL